MRRKVATWCFKAMTPLFGRILPYSAAKLALSLTLHSSRFTLEDTSLPQPDATLVLKTKNSQLSIWNGSNGKAALLVHGWGGDLSQFNLIFEELISQGFSVYGLNVSNGESSACTLYPCQFFEAIKEISSVFVGKFDVAFAHSLGAVALRSLDDVHNAKVNVMISSPASLYEMTNRYAEKLNIKGKALQHFFTLVEQNTNLNLREFNIDTTFRKSSSSFIIVHDKNDKTVPFSDAEALYRECSEARFIPTVNKGHVQILEDKVTVKLIFSWFYLFENRR